jgi:hypothetical protein
MTHEELRDIVKRLGLSQVRVAHLIGADDRTFRRWLAEDSHIPETVARVLRMADAGKLSLERLASYATKSN